MNQAGPGPAQPQPDYGPSLPELLRPRLRALGRWGRIVLGLVVLALVALIATLFISKNASVESYVQTEADSRGTCL